MDMVSPKWVREFTSNDGDDFLNEHHIRVLFIYLYLYFFKFIHISSKLKIITFYLLQIIFSQGNTFSTFLLLDLRIVHEFFPFYLNNFNPIIRVVKNRCG